jgi:hypothetical protein
MGLLTDFQNAVLEARKSYAAQTPFLVMTLSEIISRAKNDGNRAPTDQDAAKTIQASIKSLSTLLDGDPTKGLEPLPPESPYAVAIIGQRDLLKSFTSGDPVVGQELQMAVREASYFCDLPLEIKSMGAIMKRLNELYPGRIDGAQVKALILSGNV